MKNDETSEFELVLGNKQLLSGFFIVVILFAVFFVMGYIVGRNSTPVPQAAASRDLGTPPVNSRPQPPATQAPVPAASEPVKDESAAPAAAQPAETAPQAETRSTPPAAPPAAAPVEASGDEMYLQVTSLKPPAAETTVRKLKEKGFPTTLSPGPSGYQRVWVGPYTDRGKLGEDKAKLELLGFGPIVVKPTK